MDPEEYNSSEDSGLEDSDWEDINADFDDDWDSDLDL